MMRTNISRSIFCLAMMGSLGASAIPLRAQSTKITVFAAASLTEAFNAAAAAFTKKTGIGVTFSFGGSDTLATQIKEGAPVDIFASANLKQMNVVVDAALTAAAPVTFAKNRLVLVTPKANAVTSLADLTKSGTRVVLAARTVPVGGYARRAFEKLAGRPGYPADFAAAVEKNVVSNELDVKSVVTKIVLGEGDAGVVYSTDITPSVAQKVTVTPLPSGVLPDIEYPIVVLKSATNPSGARAFVDYITSAEGQAFLKARGFISP